MKEVALYEAKNNLSALVAEVEATGQAILITRHGKPAARLAPAETPGAMDRRAALQRLKEIREEIAAAGTDSAPLPWETLKKWMRDEEDEEDA